MVIPAKPTLSKMKTYPSYNPRVLTEARLKELGLVQCDETIIVACCDAVEANWRDVPKTLIKSLGSVDHIVRKAEKTRKSVPPKAAPAKWGTF